MAKAPVDDGIIALTVRFRAEDRARLHAYTLKLAQAKGTRVSYSGAIKELIRTIPDKLLDQAALRGSAKRRAAQTRAAAK